MSFLLHHSISRAAAQSPAKDAFRCGNLHISYQELEVQTNRVSNWLQHHGVKRGDRVGVYLGRTLETATAIYGIMKAGAAYVPLDPTAPAARTLAVLNDCGIEVLVTNPAFGRNLSAVVAQASPLRMILGLEADWSVATASWTAIEDFEGVNCAEVRVLDTDLAYIMYTSGTTGNPKGIMHSHRSGMEYARLSAACFNLNANDRIGNHASLFFDISTLGYFTSPLVGATTVLCSEAHVMMPASLAQLVEQEQLTVWYSVPLALTQMLELGALQSRDMSALRWVLYGGEPFSPKTLRALMEHWPQAVFSNIYGPAEVNQCTYYNLHTPPATDAPIPLGHVWGNTEACIVDDQDNAVNPGEVGELLIRTSTMMMGYWNQQALTEKKLFRQVLSGGREAVFYRTGDLAKRNAEGLLEFCGRADSQVKVRGYRVELEEVANALKSHPNVSDSVAFATLTEDGTKRIYAAIVAGDNCEVAPNELTTFVQQMLPRYAVPEQVFVMESLPRTNAGKVDVRQLQLVADQN